MATDNTQQGAPTDNSRVGPTPGPWELVRLNQFGPHAISMAYNAEQKFYGVRSIHHEADARLIAAAPELLEALEELCAKLDTISGEPFINPPDSMWGRARAAIAKARGQS